MKTLIVESKGYDSYYDITDLLNDPIKEFGQAHGIVHVCVVGSTTGLTVMRYEKGTVTDLLTALEKIAPSTGEYEHVKTTNDPNGFAHVKSNLLGTSVSIPYIDGNLALPNSHRIVLFDFDLCESKRQVYVSL